MCFSSRRLAEAIKGDGTRPTGSYAEGHSMSNTSEKYCRSCTESVHLIQGKWKIHILCSIRSGPVRLGRLRRELRTASKKVLTENLRELEDSGLIVRRDLGGAVRHVEYDFRDEVRPAIESILDHLADFSEVIALPALNAAK
jgi:DNA-binding HxlR family transcriptional regulator